MVERKRAAAEQGVGHALAADADLDQPAQEAHPEREPADARRKPRTEAERLGVVPHAAQAVHRRQPRSGQRAHVDAVAHVVLEVFDVHQRRLAEVVVRQLQMADLGGEDGLRA